MGTRHLYRIFAPALHLQCRNCFFLIFISALQRQNAKNLKQIFTEKEHRGLSPSFHIHVSVSELYISTLGLPFLLEEICGPILGIYKSLTECGNWDWGRAIPRKEYINGIAAYISKEKTCKDQMFIVSLLGVYFSCIMATVASSVVTTIMILSFHHRQNNPPHLNYPVICFSCHNGKNILC